MLVRIMARNKEEKYAYAEEIVSYRVSLVDDNKIYYVSNDGFIYTGELRDIVRNPEIIKVLVKGHFYKIKLPEGER